MNVEEIDAIAQAVSTQTKELRSELDHTILGFGDLHHELIEEKVKYWDCVMLTTRLRDEIREKDKLLRELANVLWSVKAYGYAYNLPEWKAEMDRVLADAAATGLLEAE